MYFIDTETMGYHSPITLIQYAKRPEQIHLYHPWVERCGDTLGLLEGIAAEGVCGFNLAFDVFHIQRFYNLLELLQMEKGSDAVPYQHLDWLGTYEEEARYGKCWKPAHALDLMLYARKGPYQSTMDRKPIKVGRVPREIAPLVLHELETRIPLSDIYFSKKKKREKTNWVISDCKTKDGDIDPHFVDITLSFNPSSALKVIVEDMFGVDAARFEDVQIPERYRPVEYQWAPFASAVSSVEKKWKVFERDSVIGYAWPALALDHIAHWRTNNKAKEYAKKDVEYLFMVQDKWQAPIDDNDSILACMVGSVRWRGFSIDVPKTQALRDKYFEESRSAPRTVAATKRWLTEVMTPEEVEILNQRGTKKETLEAIQKWKLNTEEIEQEDDYDNFLSALKAEPTEVGDQIHPAAERASLVLKARQAKYKVDVFDKILLAGRFHPSATVIGSFSSRMSGRTESKGGGRKGGESGLNALGIGHDKDVRACFTLGTKNMPLAGGDFVSYEICIAVANYGDQNLLADVLTCYLCNNTRNLSEFEDIECPHCGGFSFFCLTCKKGSEFVDGKTTCGCEYNPAPESQEDTLMKFHGLFAQSMYPDKTYEDIIRSKGQPFDMYDRGKRGGFSKLYGGTHATLMNRLGLDEETALNTEKRFEERYPMVLQKRKEIENNHGSMSQPGGLGTEVVWREPKDAAVSLTGFKRSFILENRVCKTIFELAQKTPREWSEFKGKVTRRDREQTLRGATMSALFAAAFKLQAACVRAAGNHEIQSTGAELCKDLQARLWTLQPSGVSSWVVQPFNIHDELMCPLLKGLENEAKEIIDTFIKEKRKLVPLLRIDWAFNMNNWSEK